MAKNYSQMAAEIIENVGGEENVLSLTHCITRLRFVLKDESKVKLDALKMVSGVIQVMIASGQYQVVIGTNVGDVYDEIGKSTKISLGGAQEADDEKPAAKKRFLNAAIDTISAVFMPFMGAFMAAGLLKGLLVILTTFNLMDASGTTYTILYAAADGIFYFMPVFLAITSAKKFGADVFVSVAVAVSLLYPSIISLYNEGASVTFIGIPVTLINYTSSVIPIIVAVYLQSKLEKLLKAHLPQLIKGLLQPVISLIVTELFVFLIIGPVTDFAATGLANGINYLLNLCPPVAGFVTGLLYPPMIIFGLHWGMIPLIMNNFAVYGYDMMLPITFATNFAIAGAVLAVFIKTKKTELKQTASSSFISAFVAGVTEPAIYGIVLKFKRPYIIVCILDAIGGAIVATMGATQTAMLTASLLTLPALATMMGVSALIVAPLGFFGGLILTYLFGYNDKMLES